MCDKKENILLASRFISSAHNLLKLYSDTIINKMMDLHGRIYGHINNFTVSQYRELKKFILICIINIPIIILWIIHNHIIFIFSRTINLN